MAIVIKRDTLRPKLKEADEVAVKAIQLAVEAMCTRAITMMREGAPWTDRTTAARNGLVAIPENQDDGASMHLIHSVPYGIWLEIRWSGRYAIIGPVRDRIAPQVLKLAGEAAIRSIGRGRA
ncbi:MAG: hypothetical protein AB7L09_22225 [Nitrospira sp.]